MGPLDTDRLPCLAAQLPDPGTGSPVILLGLTFLVGVEDMAKQSRVAVQLPGEGQWLEKGAAGLPSVCLGKPEQSLADPPGEENGIGETPQLGPAPNKGKGEEGKPALGWKEPYAEGQLSLNNFRIGNWTLTGPGVWHCWK